jgi:tRNA-specific 2-thiouridylase
VLDIEPVSGTVTVGPRDALTVDRIEADRPRWCGAALSSYAFEGSVQLRAHGAEHRARVTVVDDRVGIELLEPAQGIAPGQAAVLYDGTRVLGSATIVATSRMGVEA